MAKFNNPLRKVMLPENALKGKVAFVTGGATGLGKAMTRMFLKCGASAFIMSRNEDRLRETADELQSETSAKICFARADVRDPKGVAEAIKACEMELGLPSIVVNNAAGNFVSPTERLSPNAFKSIIDIVLLGTANVTLEIGKQLIKQQRPATFLAISATYTSFGSGYVVPSAAAKSGVETLYKSLASEWTKYGMRFNVISPGAIPTEGAFSRLDPTGEFMNSLEKLAPPNWRLGTAEELANLAAYLVSDYSSWMNGETIRIDGGLLNYLSSEFNQLASIEETQWDVMEQLIRNSSKK